MQSKIDGGKFLGIKIPNYGIQKRSGVEELTDLIGESLQQSASLEKQGRQAA